MIASAAAILEVHLADLFAGLAKDRSISKLRAEHEAAVRQLAQDLNDRQLALLAKIAAAIRDQ